MTKNPSASSSIGILFKQTEITELFAELLRARGVQTFVLAPGKAKEPGLNTKIITEAYFLEEIPHHLHGKCLIVGNYSEKVSSGASLLSRPLTEHKIETALRTFLAH